MVDSNTAGGHGTAYSILDGENQATDALLTTAGNQLSPEIHNHIGDVAFTTTTDGTRIYFPCPFKEIEALLALKSVEASAVASICCL
jgi:hypothetical protein